MNNTGKRLISLSFVFVLFSLSPSLAGSGKANGIFYLGGLYGGPMGEGVGENEFDMSPGAVLGFYGKSWRVGTSYSELLNKVGDSEVEGYFYTPFFADFLGKIYNTYDDAGKGFGICWSLGANWVLMSVDDTHGFDEQYWATGGLTLRTAGEHIGMDFWAKYCLIIENDLDQDAGLEFALVMLL